MNLNEEQMSVSSAGGQIYSPGGQLTSGTHIYLPAGQYGGSSQVYLSAGQHGAGSQVYLSAGQPNSGGQAYLSAGQAASGSQLVSLYRELYSRTRTATLHSLDTLPELAAAQVSSFLKNSLLDFLLYVSVESECNKFNGSFESTRSFYLCFCEKLYS
jgi:hypothetical protein